MFRCCESCGHWLCPGLTLPAHAVNTFGVRHAYGSISTPPATLPRMAGKPRLDVPGGFYDILARGNRSATIFHDDADYHAYSIRVPDLIKIKQAAQIPARRPALHRHARSAGPGSGPAVSMDMSRDRRCSLFSTRSVFFTNPITCSCCSSLNEPLSVTRPLGYLSRTRMQAGQMISSASAGFVPQVHRPL